ncbi:MAG: hypothetical protein R3C70_04970 [Geminicoccaceae bacterium]
MGPIPRTYEEWEHCITVRCGLAPTADYAASRIEALQNERDFHTQKFIEIWGESHRVQILQWFREAAARVSERGECV